MKRFLVFAGLDYEASGGMDDFIGDTDTLDEAINFIGAVSSSRRGKYLNWFHVFDTNEQKIVWRNGAAVSEPIKRESI